MPTSYALDTCYIVWLFENHKEDLLSHIPYVITSFHYEELLYIEHRHKISERIRESIRRFEKDHTFKIENIPVHPGDWDLEIKYVKSIDPKILDHVKDPSDAVLAAFCMQNSCNCVTRDKHDLYKALNEQFFMHHCVEILNTIHIGN